MDNPTQGIRQRFSWDRALRPEEGPALQRAPTLSAPPDGWVKVTVSAYNLKWPRLREWLINTFEKEKAQFKESQALYDDYFFFFAPRQLVKSELLAIDNLRETDEVDRWRQSVRRDRTPDRPASSTAPSIP
ncbi:hypothetical protein CTA2_12686 [Colletotrichum tanaceti]|uniref:Uncharacterized protein n=1 Tax=Colletotrichum tanaceti TaxID=1306861 RepID=A0A4U6XBA5_9PEZI|nr:hypothetical protein CTA2_12686 [Colletotrichum tanaceti]TKW52978.1 hypothetical protein CTA1_706 [Colletotrichum tanaceti]